ncbi:MAG TPA: hypothetical protein PKA88_03015 [Polyangiaceae bacterium]|nr:hypothetical protein [Polyangiaceae bacterium]
MKPRRGGRRCVALCVAPCLALAACSPAKSPRVPPAPARARLSFDWQPPAAADVTHEHEKNLTRVTTRFTLRACPAGELMSVRAIDHELSSVDEVPASAIDPDELAQVNALARATPTFLVTKDGQVYDVVGMEQAMRATLVQMRAEGRDAAILDRLEKSFASPLMTQQIKEKYSELWYLWVGSWLDVDLSKQRSTQDMTIFLGGKNLVIPTEFEVKTSTPDRTEVSLQGVLEGPAASQALSHMIRAMVSLPDGDQDKIGQLQLRRVHSATLVTDPSSMRPSRVMATMRITVTGSGPTSRRAEGDRYTFRWLPKEKAAALCANSENPGK